MNNKGFTIIEIIIAIAVLAFGIVMVYNSFAVVVAISYANAPRLTASYLAQEGLEIVRNLRDVNFINNATWSAGLLAGTCATGCQADYKTTSTGALTSYGSGSFLGLNPDGFYSYDFGATPTIYKRKITITAVSGTADAMNVDVLVSWNYNGKPYTFDANGYLYNWK